MRTVLGVLGTGLLWLSLFICAVVALTMAMPEFYLLALWSRVTGASRGVRRKRTGAWGSRWMRRFLGIVRIIGFVRTEFRLPHVEAGDKEGGIIVICNHFGGFDGPLVSAFLAEAGMEDMRTVAMREVKNIPFMNHAFLEGECAFVGRKGDPRDVESVKRFGRACMDDGACALIFPEGHIYQGPKHHGFRHVLKPRHRGLEQVMRAMPGRPVLSLTIRWLDWKHPRLSVLGVIPPGREVLVTGRMVRGIRPEHAEEWLTNEWRRKEAILSAPRY